MKQTILLVCLLMMGVQFGFSQSRLTIKHPITGRNSMPVQAKVQDRNVTGFETASGKAVSVPPSSNRFFAESVLGVTQYDLQTNSCMPNRVQNWGNGQVSAAFLVSATGEGTPYSDRGTGYNNNFAGDFGAPATTRIEAVRTGFPSYAVSPVTGEEWVTSHASGNTIHFAHRAKDATTWTEGNIPTTTPNGGLWTDVAVGGADGKTIHVIYYTTPSGNGGAAVDGMDGTIKYCRSTDNGATWDIVDASLPTVNGDNYLHFTANCYTISANGATVAIGVFHNLNSVLMFKSEDNGTTWADPRIVHKFPLKKWSFDDGYTFDQISSEFNPDIWPQPNGVTDSLAILTNDNTGDVLVDDNGIVHVAFASFFIRDADTTDDNSYSLYPGTNLGIIYWNDLMDDNAGIASGYCPDINGDGSLGTTTSQIYYDGYYGMSLSTLPTLGMDAEGRVYISYISNNELAVSTDNFFYKQPFLTRSSVDWTTFDNPQVVLQDDLVSDPLVTAFSENFYAAIAPKVDDKAHIVWQQDFTLGVTLRITGTQPAEDNQILYLGFPVDRFIVGANEPKTAINNMKLMPNPASSNTALLFDLKENAEYNISVINMAGQRVMDLNGQAVAGKNALNLNTAALNSGVYFVRVNAGAQSGVVKLNVVK